MQRTFATTNICFTFKKVTMNYLGYIGTFLGGAIAGAVLGVLLAPDKGSETRSKIAGTVEDIIKRHRKDLCDSLDDGKADIQQPVL